MEGLGTRLMYGGSGNEIMYGGSRNETSVWRVWERD